MVPSFVEASRAPEAKSSISNLSSPENYKHLHWTKKNDLNKER